MHFKMLSAKGQPFCLCLNVLTIFSLELGEQYHGHTLENVSYSDSEKTF